MQIEYGRNNMMKNKILNFSLIISLALLLIIGITMTVSAVSEENDTSGVQLNRIMTVAF